MSWHADPWQRRPFSLFLEINQTLKKKIFVWERVYLMSTGQTYAKFEQNFACVTANLLRTFGQTFCSYGQAWQFFLGKFTFIQTSLSNFAPAQILKETLVLSKFCFCCCSTTP